MKQEVNAWVDGSFSMCKGHPVYGGAAVAYVGKSNTPIECKWAGEETNMARIRNVAGELLAVMGLVETLLPLKDSIDVLYIHHDYDGISKWVTGEWQARKACTMAYKDYMLGHKDDIKIVFKHVKAHTGDYNNERADRLAKEAVKDYARNL